MKRSTLFGISAGLVAFGIAISGIVTALSVPAGGDIPGNIVTAGHLTVDVNSGQGSDISINNMASGETRTAEQLITADMLGQGLDAADLDLRISGIAPGTFSDFASIAVWASAPVADAGWAGAAGTCNNVQYSELLGPTDMSSLVGITTNINLGTFTPAAPQLCVRYEFTFDQSADNTAQGASGSINLAYSLTQKQVP